MRPRRAREPASADPGRPGPGCIELAIRPSRRLLVAGAAFIAAGLAQVFWLYIRGSPLPAAVTLLALCAIAWGLWRMHGGASATAGGLALMPDGRVVLQAGGAALEGRPRPCSLRLGPYILLVLQRRDGRALRLLLGPGILGASDLAALGRWLQRAPGRGNGPGGTAVDSRPQPPDRTCL